MARHNAKKREKCCDNHSPLKSMVHKGYNFPYSMIITQIVHAARAGHAKGAIGAKGVVFPMGHAYGQRTIEGGRLGKGNKGQNNKDLQKTKWCLGERVVENVLKGYTTK